MSKYMKNQPDSIETLLWEWRRERPDLDPAPTGIVGRISRLSGHFRRSVDKYLAEFGLTWETFDLIATLRRSGAPFEMSPTELHKATLLSASAVTNRIDRVAAIGLVTRVADASDGRSVRIKLTARGKALIDIVIARHFEGEKSLISSLSLSECEQLAYLLSKLTLAFEHVID